MRLTRPTVTAFCLYEVAALTTRRVPTLTALVHRHRTTWRGRVVIGGLTSWLLFHLFIERPT